MLKSERGNTLVLVLGFVMILGLLVIPLSGLLNNGLLHSATDGTKEAAFTQSESAAVIYKRIYMEAQASGTEMTEGDARQLASGLSSLGLYDRLAVNVTPASGMPERIAFSSWSGMGQQERGQTVELQFDHSEQSGGGGVTSPAADVFYRKHAVITDKVQYNYLFTKCGGETPSSAFFGNDYDRTKYAAEFKEYMDRYTGPAFDERFSRRPQPLSPLAVPDAVKTIPNVKTKPTAYTYTGSGGPGIKYDGDVVLKTQSSPFKISAMSAAGYDGVAIQAAGSVSLPDWNENSTIDGKLIVGGSFSAVNGKSLTINGDVMIRGDMNIGQMGSALTVKGNLIVNGNAAFTGSIDKLVVEGDMIVGGNLTFASNARELLVEGTLSTGKSLQLATATNVSVGKWTSSGAIQGNDRNSIIVGGTLKFAPITTLRATGDLSAMVYEAGSQIQTLTLGGSLLAGGSATFQSSVVNWNIGGDISAGGTLTVQSTQQLTVRGSVYAVTGVTLSDVGVSLKIAGSILSQGPVLFSNTMNKAEIGGDVISSGDGVAFGNRLFDFAIGGAIAAAKNISFTNTVDKLNVGKDIIASGSIAFENTLEARLVAIGMIAALGNIDFKNSIRSNPVQFGGFYAGGSMNIPSWAAGANAICINYNPPSGDKTVAPSKQLVITSTWSSRSYRRP